MATIGASTKHSIKVSKKKTTTGGTTKLKIGGGKKSTKGSSAGSRGSAPPLKPSSLKTKEAIDELCKLTVDEQKDRITNNYLRKALGDNPLLGANGLSAPHAASTTKDRAGAAADIAICAKELGITFVLKDCGVLDQMKLMLFPNGLESLFSQADDNMGLKPSASSASLSSLGNQMMIDDTTATTAGNSAGTDGKRGKNTPPNAREGSLLLVRALCETVGRDAEPYVVGGFIAASLDECGSSSSSIREAAEDASRALIQLAHPWSIPRLVYPVIVQSLYSTEWRVKYNALERLAQCATTAPKQICRILPSLIPLVTNQVWDTKAQVTKAAGSTLLAICKTNQNADVAPAIPAVVNAICKPAETVKALQELMHTTFVVPVDASTLSILCPVLHRGLKEKLAINKRSACLVIANMSKLVNSKEAVAPFGPLLVPELQKVANNVQFEEIRDHALAALEKLTKALGDSYSIGGGTNENGTSNSNNIMEEENARVKAEQERIEAERLEALKREEEIKRKEEEERKKFKEAMEAHRQLEKLKLEEEQEKKAEELKKREAAKLSTKGSTGKCQSCGLKKCKKSCLFYGQKK